MTLTIARFDLDETPREPNTHRSTPVWSPLPIGFPFLVDKHTGEVNAPVLSFLISKCAKPDSYSNGRWAKQRTADNYAADLKDWWAEIQASSRPWHEADEEMVDNYLLGMKLELSEHTGDFLSDATIGRRRSTLNEFHKFARRRYGFRHLPIASTSNLRNARRDGEDEDETFNAFTIARYDANPRPFDQQDLLSILDALGPMPEEWANCSSRTKGGRSKAATSRTRLALLLAVTVGLRIDEIVNLRADLFDFNISGRDEDDHFTCELKVAKGLVRRTVYFPFWLVAHLQAYIAGERAQAITLAHRNWLQPKGKPPPNLLLNTLAAGRNAGIHVRLVDPRDEVATRGETGLADIAELVQEDGGEPMSRMYDDPEATGGTAKAYNGACIQPHQWRKTFMRYAMRTDPRMAPAVSQHFKHYTVALTERDYGPKDIRFLEEADSTRARQTGSFLRRMVEGKTRPVARLDRAFELQKEQWRALVPDGEAHDDAAYTRVAIREDLRIWYVEYGRCLIALHPNEARCHERAGTAGWRR